MASGTLVIDYSLKHGNYLLAVAIGATVSWVCCAGTLSYIIVTLASAARQSHKSRNVSRLAFLRTQFGVLFLNLLLADLLQSTGFAIEWYWYSVGKTAFDHVNRHACTGQSVLIQAGDLASSFWSLTIALHTSSFIIFRYKPSSRVVSIYVSLVWLAVTFLTVMGPLHVLNLQRTGHQAGVFYDNAGLWCWVSLEYDQWRLWGHYLFVFISALGSLAAYLSIFIFLWFRLFQRGAYNHHLFALRRAADGKIFPASPSAGEKGRQRRAVDPGHTERNRKVDRAALMMLLFPLTYLCSVLPLATYRLARMTAHPPTWAQNQRTQAVCGCIFALGGFGNAILFIFTRQIFRTSGTQQQSSSFSQPAPTSISRQGMSALPGDQQRSSHAQGVSEHKVTLSDHRKSSTLTIASSTASLPTVHRQPSFGTYSQAHSQHDGLSRATRKPSSSSRPAFRRQPSTLSNKVRFNDGLSFQDSSEDEEDFARSPPGQLDGEAAMDGQGRHTDATAEAVSAQMASFDWHAETNPPAESPPEPPVAEQPASEVLLPGREV